MTHIGGDVIQALDEADIRLRRLRALAELAAGVEAAIHDAEELISAYERGRKAEALRLSREDLMALMAQREVLIWSRLLLERQDAAERSEAAA